MKAHRRDYERPEFRHPLQRFRRLMPRRVRRLLLVGSRYDSFLLEEEGRLSELILTEFLDLNLGSSPWMTRISTGEEALGAAVRRNFDLVIVTPHVRDMHALEFARRLRAIKPFQTVVPLAFDGRELDELRSHDDIGDYERPYLWQGDFGILPAIVKSLEDRWNVEHDTMRVGVSSVILIEDSVTYYSSFLPTLYSELTKQSQLVISEGANLQNKLMRLKARPKILHCINYQDAEEYYHKYRRFVLGIISDVNFPNQKGSKRNAGIEFAQMVRSHDKELPIMLQTRDPEHEKDARQLNAEMVLKGAPLLLHQLSSFMRDRFGFGEFVIVHPNGTEAGRATDLHELETLVREVPEECLMRHAGRHHFSTWLRARTEFGLAADLRHRKASDFESPGEMRGFLIESLRRFRRDREVGIVSHFNTHTYQTETSFARIGAGSLGGKARGLAFVRRLLQNFQVRKRFRAEGVEVSVPSAVVLATDVFDRFMDDNDLRDYALSDADDAAIEARFIASRLPGDIFDVLMDFLDLVDYPLAVRSSSLLEDSQFYPFTGVYETYMVPNSHPDRKVRVKELVYAIKRVYASTYSHRAKEYIRATDYRLEEEKMAVIMQRVLGNRHDERFYPDFAGVARSHNFYPVDPMRPEDGVVNAALGFGQTVVEGGRSVAFCPLYPRHPVHFSTKEAILENAQVDFFALKMEDPGTAPDPTERLELAQFPVKVALDDGVLENLGSTYSPENDAIYDGVGRAGAPLVTFAPILKHDVYPLAEICQVLLDIGSMALNMPVEIEFAANAGGAGSPQEFAFLQMRPFVTNINSEHQVEVGEFSEKTAVCFSSHVLGNGVREGLRDLLVIDRESFDRAHTRDAAQQLAAFNARLMERSIPYVLIGVGRWGASDPWLGIPIDWEQIAGAKVIVESDFRDLKVTPSQGSHFFQNMSCADVGYFTVSAELNTGYVDWDWLGVQKEVEKSAYVRHLRLDDPLTILLDGRSGRGVILKPGVEA